MSLINTFKFKQNKIRRINNACTKYCTIGLTNMTLSTFVPKRRHQVVFMKILSFLSITSKHFFLSVNDIDSLFPSPKKPNLQRLW